MLSDLDLQPLTSLRKGETAVVEEVAGDSRDLERFQEMGLTPGTIVCMLCPGRCSRVQIGDSRIVVRCRELKSVFVSPLF